MLVQRAYQHHRIIEVDVAYTHARRRPNNVIRYITWEFACDIPRNGNKEKPTIFLFCELNIFLKGGRWRVEGMYYFSPILYILYICDFRSLVFHPLYQKKKGNVCICKYDEMSVACNLSEYSTARWANKFCVTYEQLYSYLWRWRLFYALSTSHTHTHCYASIWLWSNSGVLNSWCSRSNWNIYIENDGWWFNIPHQFVDAAIQALQIYTVRKLCDWIFSWLILPGTEILSTSVSISRVAMRLIPKFHKILTRSRP